MSKEELLCEKAKLEKEYDGYLKSGLDINMTRGKPCKEQLDLAEDIIHDQTERIKELEDKLNSKEKCNSFSTT